MRCFSSPGSPRMAMDSPCDTAKAVGCPIRKSSDQCLLAAPQGFSQRATSFIASQRQGIHQMPFSHLRHITHHAQTHNRACSSFVTQQSQLLLLEHHQRTNTTPKRRVQNDHGVLARLSSSPVKQPDVRDQMSDVRCWMSDRHIQTRCRTSRSVPLQTNASFPKPSNQSSSERSVRWKVALSCLAINQSSSERSVRWKVALSCLAIN